MLSKNALLWITWLLLTTALAGWLALTLLGGEASDKTVFLPDTTSHGHYQIEQACTACHSEDWGDRDAMQAACTGCHGEALEAAKDDHPRSKFTDPRNADRIEVLDARYCVTCHVEHRPAITDAMGVTVPRDVCFLCHEGIAGERPSHAGMAFDSCASAGCHNFHDNRALYEDFLLKHMDDQDTRYEETLLQTNLREIAEQLPDYPSADHPLRQLTREDLTLPEGVELDPMIAGEWLASGHAATGVDCVACHGAETDGGPAWTARPGHNRCRSCHSGEVSGFLAGRHGMRLDEERLGRVLPPMTPAMARLPMKGQAAGHELGCQSCHGAHRYDSAEARVQSCLGCHDDEHSLAYPDSPHAKLWQKELAGEGPAGSGVSCASCHMPRLERDYYWGTFIHHEVQHNQSDNLRPNEKMLRPVCLQCHGLGFAIDALADPATVRSNFRNPPRMHIESIDLARQRADAH